MRWPSPVSRTGLNPPPIPHDGPWDGHAPQSLFTRPPEGGPDPSREFRGERSVWASLIAHGVLMVGGLGYAASTTLGLATVPKESNITLEAASPPALLAPGREAEPDAPAPLPPGV